MRSPLDTRARRPDYRVERIGERFGVRFARFYLLVENAPVLLAGLIIITGLTLVMIDFGGNASTSASPMTSTPIILIILGLAMLTPKFALRAARAVDEETRRTRQRVELDSPQPNLSSNGQESDAGEGGDQQLYVYPTTPASVALQKQEHILREIYTQGLAQAKVSFRVSIFFASTGAAFLLLGIALAVINASGNGQQYASVVAGVAGVVTNLTSGVFFVQSNRARTNMGQQGVMLREESQEDRRLNAARELAGGISEAGLRDITQARLALHLVHSNFDGAALREDSRGDSPGPKPAAELDVDTTPSSDLIGT